MNNAPKGSQLREHSFYEGASLRKFGDLYYFIYSSHVNHELCCYATSFYPGHGYEYRGVIISNGDIVNGWESGEGPPVSHRDKSREHREDQREILHLLSSCCLVSQAVLLRR